MLQSALKERKKMAEKVKTRRKQRRRVTAVDEAAIRLRIEPLAEGGYVATSPDVPGLVAEGQLEEVWESVGSLAIVRQYPGREC
jgi:hypothetical protein